MQQVLAGPTLMEEIERTNVVVVRNPLQRQGREGGKMKKNPYIMEVDWGRNCYSCGEFGYLARKCKNRERIEQERRVEYRENNRQRRMIENGQYLNRDRYLIVLN